MGKFFYLCALCSLWLVLSLSPEARGQDALAKIKETGVIKWGADAEGGAPFVFRDPNNTDSIIGFEMEIMEKLAAHLGVKAERVQTEWGQLIPNLTAAKRTDVVVNGIEVNADREKVVNFTEPYYVYEQQLTVRATDKDKYKSLDDLKGHAIGTLNDAEANNVLRRAGFSEEQIKQHPDSLTPYTDLDLKRTDAVLQETMIAAYYVEQLNKKSPKYFNVEKTFAPGKYAIVARKEDSALVAELNKNLKLMKENGELATIYKKWNMWNASQKEIGIQEK